MDDNYVMEHIYLSVLFFQEQPGIWVAQALEHDIAAQGRNEAEARSALERTVLGYLQLDAKLKRPPLSTLNPAPQVFWTVWTRLVQQRHPTARPLVGANATVPPAFVVSAISPEPVHAH